jgi:hypothetical protein
MVERVFRDIDGVGELTVRLAFRVENPAQGRGIGPAEHEPEVLAEERGATVVAACVVIVRPRGE